MLLFVLVSVCALPSYQGGRSATRRASATGRAESQQRCRKGREPAETRNTLAGLGSWEEEGDDGGDHAHGMGAITGRDMGCISTFLPCAVTLRGLSVRQSEKRAEESTADMCCAVWPALCRDLILSVHQPALVLNSC
eukprot:601639-Rhodomonas_salina.1